MTTKTKKTPKANNGALRAAAALHADPDGQRLHEAADRGRARGGGEDRRGGEGEAGGPGIMALPCYILAALAVHKNDLSQKPLPGSVAIWTTCPSSYSAKNTS
jgi:hypothetical protein